MWVVIGGDGIRSSVGVAVAVEDKFAADVWFRAAAVMIASRLTFAYMTGKKRFTTICAERRWYAE